MKADGNPAWLEAVQPIRREISQRYLKKASKALEAVRCGGELYVGHHDRGPAHQRWRRTASTSFFPLKKTSTTTATHQRFRTVGRTYRRLKFEDVLAYKQKRDLERDGKLDELARLTEELGGYDKPKSGR